MIHASAQPRTHRPDAELVPRAMVRAVAALVLLVFTMVTIYSLAEGPVIAAPTKGDVAISRDVILWSDLSGAASVTALDGTPIATLSSDEGGFVAGVWRVIQRQRILNRVALEGPVTLIGHDSGRVSIQDPATGWSADLMGFGADNARVFARLLVQQEGGQ